MNDGWVVGRVSEWVDGW